MRRALVSLAFAVVGGHEGTATITVHARKAKSRDNGLALDGNAAPASSNGVGPAGDDFVWSIPCKQAPKGVSVDIDCGAQSDEIGSGCTRVDTAIITGASVTIHPANVTGTAANCTLKAQLYAGDQIVFNPGSEQAKVDVPLGAGLPPSVELGGVAPGRHMLVLLLAGGCSDVRVHVMVDAEPAPAT